MCRVSKSPREGSLSGRRGNWVLFWPADADQVAVLEGLAIHGQSMRHIPTDHLVAETKTTVPGLTRAA